MAILLIPLLALVSGVYPPVHIDPITCNLEDILTCPWGGPTVYVTTMMVPDATRVVFDEFHASGRIALTRHLMPALRAIYLHDATDVPCDVVGADFALDVYVDGILCQDTTPESEGTTSGTSRSPSSVPPSGITITIEATTYEYPLDNLPAEELIIVCLITTLLLAVAALIYAGYRIRKRLRRCRRDSSESIEIFSVVSKLD